MRWDDLQLFLVLTRHGRIEAAAKALGLSAAAVGRRLDALEAQLGASLIERGPRGAVPTEAGQALIAHVEAMEQIASGVAEEIGGRPDRLTGTVRIGAPDGVSNYLLPEACAALSRDNPGLEVQVVALSRLFSLSKREADLAITVSPPTAGRLTVRKIGDYRLHLYAAESLAARLGPIRRIEDLRGLRGVGYISDMIFDRTLDYYALLGRESDPALTSNSLIVQMRWCRMGAGVGILPDFVAAAEPGLVRLLPEEISLTRSFYLVRHQDDARLARLNRVAERVVAHMRERLARLDSDCRQPAPS